MKNLQNYPNAAAAAAVVGRAGCPGFWSVISVVTYDRQASISARNTGDQTLALGPCLPTARTKDRPDRRNPGTNPARYEPRESRILTTRSWYSMYRSSSECNTDESFFIFSVVSSQLDIIHLNPCALPHPCQTVATLLLTRRMRLILVPICIRRRGLRATCLSRDDDLVHGENCAGRFSSELDGPGLGD